MSYNRLKEVICPFCGKVLYAHVIQKHVDIYHAEQD